MSLTNFQLMTDCIAMCMEQLNITLDALCCLLILVYTLLTRVFTKGCFILLTGHVVRVIVHVGRINDIKYMHVLQCLVFLLHYLLVSEAMGCRHLWEHHFLGKTKYPLFPSCKYLTRWYNVDTPLLVITDP